MTCDYCGASTSNGLALCQACQGMLVMLLEYVTQVMPSELAGIPIVASEPSYAWKDSA